MRQLTAVEPSRWAFTLCALLLSAAACSSSKSGSHVDGGLAVVDSGSPSVDAGGGGTDAGLPDAGSSDGGSPDGGGLPPTINTVTPPRGPIAGGTNVVLFGANFVYGFAFAGGQAVSIQTQVFFGTQQVAINGGVNVIDDQTMEAVAPPGVRGSVDITLTNPNGTVVCSKCFTYVEDIAVTRLSVTSGPTLGGQQLTVFGKGFSQGMLVLVGGSEALNVTVSPDGTQISLTTPPGTAGSADVGVIAPDAAAFLRRGYVYVAPVQVTSVTPAASPLAGGVSVSVAGSGFTSDAQVMVGGQAATTTFISDSRLTATVPAAMAAGAVDVVVTTGRSAGTLTHGFAYFDDSRDPQIFGVYPAQGPVAGGTAIQLVGTGLSGAGLDVKFGGNDAAFTATGDDHVLTVTLPAGAAPGLVDVQFRTTRGGAVLPNGFGYVIPLTLTGIAPATADASGTPAVSATVQGTGLDPTCQVLIGSTPAVVQGAAPGGAGLIVTVPAGPPGPRDVTVSCGTPGSPLHQQAVLVGQFTYTTPMKILKVDPESGAIAGNTAVTVYGSGFVPNMQVLFGSAKAPVVDVKSPNMAVVRTPRGDVGFVDVIVKTVVAQDTLPSAFGYTNPQNVLGGGSGGPMRGILNVSVLNSTPNLSGPVPGVTISINADQLTGVTDDRGQVTFSDSSLLKPVTITGSKPMFAVSSIARIDARNVTIFMQLNMAPSGPPSSGPPPPGPAVFKGRVCGFKTAPGTPIGAGHKLEAHVYLSAPYVYAAPPFGQPQTPIVVTSDCGSFQLSTRRFGRVALWAEFGISDTTTSPATFTPLIMGIRRSLEADPGKETDGVDIILDMHRDVTFPVTIDETQLGLGGTTTIMNDVFSYLDLGGEGVIPLAEARSTNSLFPFDHHPRIGGDGLIFLNLAAEFNSGTGGINPPYSLYYRRQYGDLAAGVTIGPMLSFTHWDSPLSGQNFTGTLSWSFLGGLSADLQQLSLTQGFAQTPIWDVILPGNEQGITVPPSATASIPAGASLNWTLITAKSPRLDYNELSFQQLGVNEWTSFTQDFGTLTTAP